jgi:hypothetical protein
MGERPAFRASDGDRERAAAEIREHYAVKILHTASLPVPQGAVRAMASAALGSNGERSRREPGSLRPHQPTSG